ncbi:MAG: UvrD-helicase domain-containing protein, partial [Dokdonella sp.]
MNHVAQPAPTMANRWGELSLDPGGRSLIEASAGTGKTWTIAVLYLRLLLEQQRSPTGIVVTTFTDAAAQELRERIRGKILWAEQLARVVLADTSQPVDLTVLPSDERWLRGRWQSDAGDVSSDLNRLRLALAELDRAPISTLHGLCRRILSDLPFDSASPFELGDMVSSDSIDGELADDLLRRLGQGTTPLSIGDGEWWATAGNLRSHLRKVLPAGIEIQRATPEQIIEFMQPESAAMLRIEIGDGSQFKSKASKLRTRLEALATFIEGEDFHAACPPTLAELPDIVSGDLTTQLRPGAIESSSCADAIEFVKTMSALIEFLPFANRAEALTAHQTELRTQRRQRLAARGQVTFDELIERVARILGDERNTLADQLFASWPVAMVDEFQDTDAQQYGILDRIYRNSDGSPRGRLVMIGDPKQAIYRFRGGDIEAYLEAKKSATALLTLGENFRSSRQLVGAVNMWFEHVGQSLSTQDVRIGYQSVEPSDRCDSRPYRVNGKVCIDPLQFHYWDDGIPDAADARRDAALIACANHIVELLASGQHRIGDELLKPGDIAVLLPSNHHIHSLRDLLVARCVPCVATARSSVLESEWAREVQIILHAALHSGDPGAVRAALATRLGGKTYDDLRGLIEQPDALQSEARLFVTMGELWSTQGVLAALQ